jgi:hypothetical protein
MKRLIKLAVFFMLVAGVPTRHDLIGVAFLGSILATSEVVARLDSEVGRYTRVYSGGVVIGALCGRFFRKEIREIVSNPEDVDWFKVVNGCATSCAIVASLMAPVVMFYKLSNTK